ncbi:putative membrane protein [Mycobacterium ulcerans str. Harvey]|uniref:Membrane protein n=1 Tax=Mycobacterium ulcerans str. Harvey TaxID=1299332 RepID=A0ABP3AMN9_MYCUL|nr:putative membrane protein [Mycobacterium ulcerans str. Harvey]
MRIARRETAAVTVGVVLVAAAFVLPRLDLGVKPRRDIGLERFASRAGAAPIFGYWDIHASWGTIAAILLALAVLVWGPRVARKLSWRVLPLATWATACGWAFSLAMIDGFERGFAGRLTTKDEYLSEVGGVTDIPVMLRTFASRIVDYQPNSWTTHVSGHPPGALLTFVWLDRIGLGGGAWAGFLCLLVGSSAAAAMVIAVGALAGKHVARRAAPFVAIAPTAIWIAVSADGYFAGVTAWGITLLAIAVHGGSRFRALWAAGAGLVLGWAIFLSYGLALMGLPALAVLASANHWRTALKALWPAVLAALGWRWPSPSRGSGGSTGTRWCSSATGRASPMTGRFSIGPGPISRAWSAPSDWAASPGSAGWSMPPRSAAAPVCTCRCWAWWPPSSLPI